MIKIVQEYAQTFSFCKQMTEELRKNSMLSKDGQKFLVNNEKLIQKELNDRQWALDVCDPEASELDLTATEIKSMPSSGYQEIREF